VSTFLTFLFVIWMIISTFLQAEDNPKKKYISPGLTAICGILILVSTLIGNVPTKQGIVLSIALILLASSDWMFEHSVKNDDLFPIAMVFGVLSGFSIGILFNLTAYSKGIPLWWLGVFILAGIILTANVYRYLQVEAALKIPVYIYLVQAVILFSGGLASIYTRNYSFAIWGIFIYFSDTLVGIRAFPNPERPICWLHSNRLLFLIITLYYSAQYALVSWAW
jgi:hypothetical protein